MNEQPVPINRAARRRAHHLPIARQLTEVRAGSFDLDSVELLVFIEAARALGLMMRIENFINDDGGVSVEVVSYLERIPITPAELGLCWALPDHWAWTDRSELYVGEDDEWASMLRDRAWRTHESRSIWFHSWDGERLDAQHGEYLWFVEFSDRALRGSKNR